MILRALKPSKKYDAIVVGSGTGGAPLALRLGERGLQVLVVEQGNFLKVARGPEVSPPGKFIVDVLGSRNAPLTFVGGRSKFYGAALYRFRESDFQEVQHEAGVSPRWPITYSDLETYYDEAEVLFRVHGSSDGDPTEPVRKRVYPFPPIPHQPVVNEVVDRLRSTGTSVANIPSGIDYGGEGKCILCSRCDAHFCTLGAKMDAETASMQPALATGNVDLLLEAEVLCVNTNPAGRDVAGVTLKLGNERTDVDAKVVAVCCGFPNSAMLLYRSRTERHPNGLGNHSGALGRYYGGHSVGMIFPLVAWRGMPSVFTKTFAINEFYNGGPGWSYPMGVIQAAGQMPFWREAPRADREAHRCSRIDVLLHDRSAADGGDRL